MVCPLPLKSTGLKVNVPPARFIAADPVQLAVAPKKPPLFNVAVSATAPFKAMP